LLLEIDRHSTTIHTMEQSGIEEQGYDLLLWTFFS